MHGDERLVSFADRRPMSVVLPNGNDPFLGGSKTPNAPPPALGGAIAPAQTGVGDPIAGVNVGAPFFARNNRGSNIGIPYISQ